MLSASKSFQHRHCFVAPFSTMALSIAQQSILWSDTAMEIITYSSLLTNDDLAGVVSEFGCRGLVLSCSADGKEIRLWDASTQECIVRINGHTGGVISAIFSKDESKVLSASADTTIRLWNSELGTELMKFEGHTGYVNSAIFSNGFRMYPD